MAPRTAAMDTLRWGVVMRTGTQQFQNQQTGDLETEYVASGTEVLPRFVQIMTLGWRKFLLYKGLECLKIARVRRKFVDPTAMSRQMKEVSDL